MNKRTLLIVVSTAVLFGALAISEACIHEHVLNPQPVYLAAAAHAIEMLPPLK